MIFGFNGAHGGGYLYVPFSCLALYVLWLVSVVATIILWAAWKKSKNRST